MCPPLGIAAILVGNQARRRIDESRGMLSGRGWATTGIVLGWLSITLMVIVGLVLLAPR